MIFCLFRWEKNSYECLKQPRLTLIKYRTWGDLTEFYFSQFWRLVSPRSRCCKEGFILRLLPLAFRSPLCSCVLTRLLLCAWTEGEGERQLYAISSPEDTNPITRTVPSWPHVNYLLKAPSSNHITFGVKTSTQEFGEDANIMLSGEQMVVIVVRG